VGGPLDNKLDSVEDVLMSHMYTYPTCDNLIRMNDRLWFEHETRLPNGSVILVVYCYTSKDGLVVDRVFDKNDFKDLTTEYKSHPSVLGVLKQISDEIDALRAAEQTKRNS
jgi:hypothetical protein